MLAGSGRVGTVRNITMTLVQGGKNLNEIKRTLAGSTYPHVPDPITGVVNADGRLTLAATRWTYTDFDFPDVIIGVVQVGPMDLNLDGAGGMTGRWSEDLTSLEGRRGTAHTENELGTVTLSTGSPWDYANRAARSGFPRGPRPESVCPTAEISGRAPQPNHIILSVGPYPGLSPWPLRNRLRPGLGRHGRGVFECLPDRFPHRHTRDWPPPLSMSSRTRTTAERAAL